MKSSILKELQRIELAIRGIDPLADIAELEAAQSDIQALIVALQAADTSLQAQISGNDSDISALQAVDTSLQSQISGNDSDISALQAADTSLQSQISGNDSDISALQAADTSLQSQISGNDGDISGHNSRIVALEALGGGGTGLSVAVLQDQKPAGTHGGTFTAGAWRARDLNTIVSDPDSIIVSLTSNRFALAAGSFLIVSRSPAERVNRHKLSLYDTTNNIRYLGQTDYASGGFDQHGDAVVIAQVGSSVYEISHIAEVTASSYGFGIASNFGTEIYTTVLVIKVG